VSIAFRAGVFNIGPDGQLLAGESPRAAEVAGIAVQRLRMAALLFGGALGGLAAATLLIAQAGTFAEGMSGGRGFIAIAIVVLGRWHPAGVAVAAIIFGAASALQFLLQALGQALPYELFLATPYLLTLGALAGVAGRFVRRRRSVASRTFSVSNDGARSSNASASGPQHHVQ